MMTFSSASNIATTIHWGSSPLVRKRGRRLWPSLWHFSYTEMTWNGGVQRSWTLYRYARTTFTLSVWRPR